MKAVVLLLLTFASGLVLAACAPFRPSTAGLNIVTVGDVPAQVFLNGQYVADTPFLDKQLQPGLFQIKIQPFDDQLSSVETQLQLRRGILSVVSWQLGDSPQSSGGITLELEPIDGQAAAISIVTQPAQAIIGFSDQDNVFAPLVLDEVEPGEHQVTISLPGYEQQQHTVNLVRGHRLLVTTKLAQLTQLSDPPTVVENEPATTTESSNNTSYEELPTSPNTSQNVTILPTNFFQSGREVLRVRTEPSLSGAELGFAEVGESYPLVTTQDEWLQIEIGGELGWVSSRFGQVE